MGIESVFVASLIAAAISTAASVGLSIIAARLSPKPPTQEVNKQADLRVQLSEYGQPFNRIYGTMGSVAGQVVWATDIKETQVLTKGQGGKRKTPDVISFSYSCSLMVLVSDCTATGSIQGIVEIYADDELIYSGGATSSEVSLNIPGAAGGRIFLGTETQLPSAKIEAERGVGNATAHRGFAGFELWDFVLDRYGNRIPNFTCKVVHPTTAVGDIIKAECRLGGLIDDEVDVTEVAGVLHGCWFQALSEPRKSLEQLATAFQLEFIEVDGKVKALQRPQAAIVVIPFDDLGSYQEGRSEGEAPRLQLSRRQDQEIPRRVEVIYHDPARTYEQNTQSFGREVYGGDSVEPISLQLALSANEADRIAKVVAITNWTERMPVQFSLPSDYLWLSPGDVVTITTPAGNVIDVHIANMEFPAPGVITCKGSRQIAEAYDQIGEGDPGQAGPLTTPSPYDPDDTDFVPLDIPPLFDTDEGTTGLYVAGAPMHQGQTWEGYTVYRQLGDEGQLQALASITQAATMGSALTVLLPGAGLDTVNSVDVQITSGSLSAITDDDFNATETVNLAVLGIEVIQFRDVIKPDPIIRPDIYRLSHLKRGLRTSVVTAHTLNEKLILANSAVRRIQVNTAEGGQTYRFRAVTLGRDVDDAPDVPHVITASVGGDAANTALSNLASVAINTSLLSDTDNTDDLGSGTKRWKDLYLGGAVKDANSNEILKVSGVASAVNEFTIANAATGTPPKLSTSGDDTDVSMMLAPKGTGSVIIEAANPKLELRDTDASDFIFDLNANILGLRFVGDGTMVSFSQSSGKVEVQSGNYLRTPSIDVVNNIRDTNSNEVFVISSAGSAVNEFTVANAATGGRPTLSATGGDTNIGITVSPKGTGDVRFSNNVKVSQTGSFTSQAHALELDVSGSNSGLLVVGGSGSNEIWKDTTPTKATSFGMAVPGTAITDDFIISGFNGSAWSQLIKIKQNGFIVGVPKRVHTNSTPTGNVTTGLDSLHSFSLPAAFLAANGDSVRAKYGGLFVTNDNNKRIVISFAGQTVHDPGLFDQDAGSWSYDIEYLRVSDTSVRFSLLATWNAITVDGAQVVGGNGLTLGVTGTITVADLDVNASTMLVQAEGTATDDIIQNFSIIDVTQNT